MTSLRTIARNTAFQAGGEALSKVASLAFYIVMARELGKAGFGAYMFALSLTVLLTSLAGFGTDGLLTRAVARDRAEVHGLFWNAIAVKVTLGIALGAIAVLVTIVGDYPGVVQATVAILAAASIAELVSKTIAATFLAHDDMRPAAAGLVLQRFSTAIVGVAALVAGAGIAIVAVTYLGGALLGLAYVYRALVRRGIRPRPDIGFGKARRVAATAVPFGLQVLFGTIIFRIDATILSLYKGDEAVGLYSAAYRALESTLFLVYAFEAAIFPTFSRLGRDTAPPVGSVYEIGLKAIVMVMAPFGAAFLLFGGPILELLYGSAYTEGERALQWLGGATALYGVSFIALSLIVAQGRVRIVAWVSGLVMVENIVLNLLVIPRFSLTGAAAVTTITEITQAIVLGWFALRLTGRISGLRVFAAPVAGCVAMVACGLALPQTLPFLAVGFLIYVLAAAGTERLLFPDDLRRLTSAVRRRLRPA